MLTKFCNCIKHFTQYFLPFAISNFKMLRNLQSFFLRIEP